MTMTVALLIAPSAVLHAFRQTATSNMAGADDGTMQALQETDATYTTKEGECTQDGHMATCPSAELHVRQTLNTAMSTAARTLLCLPKA